MSGQVGDLSSSAASTRSARRAEAASPASQAIAPARGDDARRKRRIVGCIFFVAIRRGDVPVEWCSTLGR
jgi:hypothetical protein